MDELYHYILLIKFHKNIYCDPSSELSPQEGSDEGSQHEYGLYEK